MRGAERMYVFSALYPLNANLETYTSNREGSAKSAEKLMRGQTATGPKPVLGYALSPNRGYTDRVLFIDTERLVGAAGQMMNSCSESAETAIVKRTGQVTLRWKSR